MKTVCYAKEISHEKPHTIWFHSHEVSRRDNSIETKVQQCLPRSGMAGGQETRRGSAERLIIVQGFFWGDENILKLWWWLHNCEYAKTKHYIKWVGFMVCELHLNKTPFKKSVWTYCLAQGTLFSTLWWPKWKGNPKKWEYMYMYSWFTFLYSRNNTTL